MELKKISDRLDEVASSLEVRGYLKEAYEIDMCTNLIDGMILKESFEGMDRTKAQRVINDFINRYGGKAKDFIEEVRGKGIGYYLKLIKSFGQRQAGALDFVKSLGGLKTVLLVLMAMSTLYGQGSEKSEAEGVWKEMGNRIETMHKEEQKRQEELRKIVDRMVPTVSKFIKVKFILNTGKDTTGKFETLNGVTVDPGIEISITDTRISDYIKEYVGDMEASVVLGRAAYTIGFEKWEGYKDLKFYYQVKKQLNESFSDAKYKMDDPKRTIEDLLYKAASDAVKKIKR